MISFACKRLRKRAPAGVKDLSDHGLSDGLYDLLINWASYQTLCRLASGYGRACWRLKQLPMRGFAALSSAVLRLFEKPAGELFEWNPGNLPGPVVGSEKRGKVYGESFPVRRVIEASLA